MTADLFQSAPYAEPGSIEGARYLLEGMCLAIGDEAAEVLKQGDENLSHILYSAMADLLDVLDVLEGGR